MRLHPKGFHQFPALPRVGPLGCIERPWESLGCSSCLAGNGWDSLGIAGMPVCGTFWKSWENIGYIGISWEHYGYFGNSWEHIGCFGDSWEHIGYIGSAMSRWEWLGGLCQGWELMAAASCFLGLRAYLNSGTAQELPYACEGKLQNIFVRL